MRITSRAWQTISVTLENVGAVERVEGDPKGILARVDDIKSRGDAAASKGPVTTERGWAPDDTEVDVPFTVEETDLVITLLVDDISVYRSLLSTEQDATSRAEQEKSIELIQAAMSEVQGAQPGR